MIHNLTIPSDPLALLEAARWRLLDVQRFRATLDRAHETLAKRNPALTATAEGEAWFNVSARANVVLSCCRRELDALLDGDMEAADSARRCRDIVTLAIEDHLPALERALDGTLDG